MAAKTFFLVVEGIDGSGKSSITRKLIQALEGTLGRYAKLTFEPHDPSCAGLFIRQVLMKKISTPTKTLALAFAANRADHCDREIIPFLQQANGHNRVVICDRYYLSSLVYQSTPDFGFEDVMALNSSAIRPDLTLFLTASSKTCYDRMRIRGDEKELFEVNLNQTRAKYLDAIDFLKSRGEKIITIDADGSMHDVFDAVKKAIFANSPEWLRFQNELPFDEFDKVFDYTKASVDLALQEIANALPEDSIDRPNGYIEAVKVSTRNYIDRLRYNDVASLFLDYLKKNSYITYGKLPWTDLDAYEVSCTLPLGVIQRGAALLLGETQRYDVVLTKLLATQKYKNVEQMSDFLFLFDSNPSHLRTNYYEREKLVSAGTQQVSPALIVIGREEISDFLVDLIMTKRTEVHP